MIAKSANADSVRLMFIPGFGLSQKRFAAQFEPDGLGYLYRKNFKEAPIRVSAEERDVFVKSFDRTLLCGFILLAVGTVAVILWVTFSAIATGDEVSKVRIFVGLGILMAVFLTLFSWAWTTPARVLSGRMASGAALTQLEVTRKTFERLPWINFPIGIGLFVVMFLKLTGGRDLLSGWNPLWLALTVAAVCFALVQAYRKWRFERRDKG